MPFSATPCCFTFTRAFSSGIDAFNKTADLVNKLQPGTKWRGLGDIVQHLYLERMRDDGNFDIRLYSRTIHLFNEHKHDAVFFVEKEEDFASPLKVFVDGVQYPFQSIGRRLRLELPIENGKSREIEIKYGSELNLAKIDISKGPLKITVIRLLSDFRDNTVSTTSLGRRFIRSYVDHGRDWNRAMVILMSLMLPVIGGLYMRKNKKLSLADRSDYTVADTTTKQ